MTSSTVYVVYRQSLNWTDEKIERHLLARDDDSPAQLGFLLALISRRLPHLGKGTTVFDDPVTLCDCLLAVIMQCSDEDSVVVVEALSDIALDYIDKGMELEFMEIQLLIHTASRICTHFKGSGMLLLRAVKAISRVVNECLSLEAVFELASRKLPCNEEQRLLRGTGEEREANLLIGSLTHRSEPEISPVSPVSIGTYSDDSQLSSDALQVLLKAREVARLHKSSVLGTEHILHGLIILDTSRAGICLSKFDLTVDMFQDALGLSQSVVASDKRCHDIPLSWNAALIMALARAEADSEGEALVDTEHILWSIIVSGVGRADLLLREKGVDMFDLARALLEEIDS